MKNTTTNGINKIEMWKDPDGDPSIRAPGLAGVLLRIPPHGRTGRCHGLARGAPQDGEPTFIIPRIDKRLGASFGKVSLLVFIQGQIRVFLFVLNAVAISVFKFHGIIIFYDSDKRAATAIHDSAHGSQSLA
jgi:hypothetical protein